MACPALSDGLALAEFPSPRLDLGDQDHICGADTQVIEARKLGLRGCWASPKGLAA